MCIIKKYETKKLKSNEQREKYEADDKGRRV